MTRCDLVGDERNRIERPGEKVETKRRKGGNDAKWEEWKMSGGRKTLEEWCEIETWERRGERCGPGNERRGVIQKKQGKGEERRGGG